MTIAAHRYTVRVFYEDTDAAGVVYYANYLRFAERARTEMLRSLGLEQATLAERFGLRFAVRHCTIDYRRSARLDDLLSIETRVTALTGARLEVAQAIERDGALAAALQVTLVAVDRTLRPVRLNRALPPDLLNRLWPPASQRARLSQSQREDPPWTK